jgi:hypothetical protein
VVWWVVYQRGSFILKERYTNAQHAHARCGGLFTKAQYLRIIAGDDAEAAPILRYCFELPLPASPSV